MFERFTDRARKVMALANEEAKRFNHEYIGSEHILLGLVKESSGVGANVLKNLDVDLRKVRLEVEKLVKAGPEVVMMGKLPVTPRAKKVIEFAIEGAKSLNHNYVGTEHLLLGLITERDGVAAQVLMNLGLNLQQVREEIIELLGTGAEADSDERLGIFGEPAPRASSRPIRKKNTPALDAFGEDITELIESAEHSEIIGRDRELERVIQVLCRRTKGNPLLIGEPGVGKRSIVHGLAARISSGKVPLTLREYRIVKLDLGLMIAGTKYRGQFEERTRAVLNEAKRSKNIVLFLPDMDEISMEPQFQQLIAPSLVGGEIRLIGICSPKWFRDANSRGNQLLVRAFSEIPVAPPTEEQTREILRAARSSYEAFHGVKISDEAVDSAVELGTLFRPSDRHPANAMEIMDEAGAAIVSHLDEASPEVEGIDLRIEALVLKKDELVREANYESAGEVVGEISNLRSAREMMVREWEDQCKVRRSESLVDEDAVIDAVALITGHDPEKIRARDTEGLAESPLVRDTALAEFERLQTKSVISGDGIEIAHGTGFVLLPHKPEYEDIYKHAIQPALEANRVDALKGDDIYAVGTVLNQVWNQIRQAEVIIADVSGSNPNVVFELGLCFGLRRFPILLCQNAADLPFNLRSLRHIEYTDDVGGVTALKEKLTDAIAAFLTEVRKPRDMSLDDHGSDPVPIIGTTGNQGVLGGGTTDLSTRPVGDGSNST